MCRAVWPVLAMTTITKRKKDLALDSINAAASCFDRLFGHVAPVFSPISSNTLIEETKLTAASLEWIQHLSRGLITALAKVNEIEEESPTLLEELKFTREKLNEEQKRVHLLQDFLVNELANSDSLATEIRNLKESLSSTLKQRDNYKEKCDSQIEELRMLATKSNNNQSSFETKSDATAILSQSLLGKYVKKTFKGYGIFYAVVVGYLKPFYKVPPPTLPSCLLNLPPPLPLFSSSSMKMEILKK
jgi:cAMP phosphodiesterase